MDQPGQACRLYGSLSFCLRSGRLKDLLSDYTLDLHLAVGQFSIDLSKEVEEWDELERTQLLIELPHYRAELDKVMETRAWVVIEGGWRCVASDPLTLILESTFYANTTPYQSRSSILRCRQSWFSLELKEKTSPTWPA